MKKSYKSFFIFTFIGLMVVFFFTSCFKKEDFNFKMLADQQTVDYDLAFPLISTDLSLGKILGSGDLVYADKDGLMRLVFTSKNKLSLNVGNLLKIPNQMLPTIEIYDVPYYKKDTIVRILIKDTIPFKLIGDGRVDSIRMSSFALETAVRSKVGSVINYSIKIESLIDKYGKPLVLKDSIAKLSERGTRVEYGSYMLNLIPITNNGGASIVLSVELEMNMSQVTNELPNIKYGDISVSLDLKDLQFVGAYGYFNKTDFIVKDSINFSLFSDVTVNQLKFEEAFLSMNFTNGASMPCRIKESEVTAYFKNGNTSRVDLLAPNYDIPYPLHYDIPMLKKTTVTSDVKNLVDNIPNKFVFSFSGSTNPDNNSKVLNVISKDSKIEGDLSFVLPLNVFIDGYVLTDTFDFTAIQNVSSIKEFLIKANLKNTFPVNVNLKLTLLGARDTVLFDFLKDEKIKGASVDAQGKVNQPEYSLLQIPLTKENIAKLGQVEKMAVYAILDTKDKGNVKIFMDSDSQGYLGIRLGAQIKYKGTLVLK